MQGVKRIKELTAEGITADDLLDLNVTQRDK